VAQGLLDDRRDLRPSDFIDLDRRFVPHDSLGARDSDLLWADVLASREETRDWAWLNRYHTVALLAEAGSGKTYEFQAQVDAINVAGGFAFFFRVERLCRGSLAESFETTSQKAHFAKWLSGGGEGRFFLDSVDEAKLPHSDTAEPLRDALRSLEQGIGDRLDRVRLVVSCRGSEWYGETEQAHIAGFSARQRAALTKRGIEFDEGLLSRNLSFAALDRDRVALIGAAQGDRTTLLEILDEEQLWAEVRTPMDAVHFAVLVAEAQCDKAKLSRLRSRTDVLQASVRRRLRDRPDSRSRTDLSPETAYAAATYLAFAVTMMQNRDLSFDQPVEGALDVAAIFGAGPAALSGKQVRQLLATPLFTPAGRGAVRFYRPEVAAMLAADYLKPQLEFLTPRRLFDAFVRKQFGLTFVPAAYGAMLAWLSAQDLSIMRLLRQVGAEHLIEEGDPRAIAIGDRAKALERHALHTCGDLPGGFFFPNEALARFAEPELEVAAVALARTTPPSEAKLHLLQVLRMGRYTSAADWLEHLCGDGFTPSEIRIYAMRALIACGTPAHLRRVADALLLWGRPLFPPRADIELQREDDARIQLIGAAYPGAIDLRTMFLLLRQVRGREYARDSDLFAILVERAPAAELEQLVEGLEALTWSGKRPRPFDFRSREKTRNADLLYDGLCRALARLIETAPEQVRLESIDWCLMAGRHSRLDRDGAQRKRLMDALGSKPALRAHLFEAVVAEARDGNRHALAGIAERLRTLWSIDHRALAVDVAAIFDAYDRAAADDRPFWAELLIRWVSHRSRKDHRRRARKLMWNALRHRGGIDWKSLSEARWRPFLWVRRWRYSMGFDGWYRLRYRWRNIREQVGVKWWMASGLVRNWRGVRDGKHPQLLYRYIFDDGFDHLTREEVLDRRPLLGRRLLDGACNWVGRIVPSLDYLPHIRRLIESGACWLDDEDQNFPSDLNESARRALVEHALSETDTPAPWVETLARSDLAFWGLSASDFLIASLEQRWPRDPEHSCYSLRKLASLPPDLRAAAAPALLTWAETCPLPARVDISDLGEIVEADLALQPRWSALVGRRMREAFHSGEMRRSLEWLLLQSHNDVGAAELLCTWFETLWQKNGDAAHDGLITLGRMFGSRRDDRPPVMASAPAALRLRIALLVREMVAPEDDEPYREGLQEMSPRRSREDIRHAAERYLAADRSEKGHLALRAYCDVAVAPRHAEWARRWVSTHAREAGNPAAWTLEQLCSFATAGTIPPLDGDTLQQRIIEEIADIQHELGSSEFDRSALFHGKVHENDFRAWLGHELDRRIGKWAAITQETVTRSEKRSDLRIELTGGNRAVLVVEIKLAHGWPRKQLLEKIETQLVDQYLIGNARIRHGLYLLVDYTLPLKGALDDGSSPELDDLMSILDERAVALSEPGGNRILARLFRTRS
jgi:hypothetical protein